jgi:hypothetical protein
MAESECHSMKRTHLLLGIFTLGAVAWAAVSIRMLFETGMGPLGLFSVRELAVTPQGITYYRFHFHWLAVVGTFLPLGMVGALWVWRRTHSSNG